MKGQTIILIFTLIVVNSVDAARAEDKSEYTLFNPTPVEKMREFSTDRPDKTESAYSVDAGHFQHETDIVNVAFDSDSESTSSTFLLAAPNMKVGLTNSTDIQIVAQSYVYDKISQPNSKMSGFGDLLVRLKHNIWGNDGGSTALAVMPYVKLPTNRGDLGNNSIEGGLIVPFAWSPSDSIGMGAMSQIDILKKDDGSGNYVQFVNSATVGTELFDSIGGYAEIWSASSSESGHQVTLDFGLTYSPCDNLQFDLGVNVGATNSADDYNPFVGISQRF